MSHVRCLPCEEDINININSGFIGIRVGNWIESWFNVGNCLIFACLQLQRTREVVWIGETRQVN